MEPDSFRDLTRRVREFIRACSAGGAPAPGSESFEYLALDLFAAQFEVVAPYQRFATRQGLRPPSVTDWRTIPAVPTAAFKDFEFTSLAPDERTAVFHSSGTTSQRPSRHFHDGESLEVYVESLCPWFERHLLPEDVAGLPLRPLALTPPPSAAPHSSLVYMLAEVMADPEPIALPGEHGAAGPAHGRRSPARFATDEALHSPWFGQPAATGGWELRVPALIEVLAACSLAGPPVCLLGTALSFVQLLDAMAAVGRPASLPAGSRVMETGGYKGRARALPKAGLHALISQWLGVPATHIISEYGMSELGSQAYDGVVGRCEPRRYRFPPWARAVVVSPETGEEVADGGTGMLRVYDLANVRSVLAVQTEDLAVRRGDGFELLGRAARAEPRGCSLMAA